MMGVDPTFGLNHTESASVSEAAANVALMGRRFEMTLTFATVRCDRCGNDRLGGERCAACGRKPHFAETQPHLQRRRRVVELFREQRAPAAATWTQAEELRGELDDTLDSLAKALADVAAGGNDPQPLVRAFSRLDLTVSAWTQLHPRPRRNWARRVGAAFESLREAGDLFVEALVAPTALAAQAAVRHAQDALDQAHERLHDLAEYRKFSSFDGDDVGLFIEQLMASNRLGLGSSSLTELDASSRERHGLSSGATAGAGVELDLYRPIVVLALDEDRVARTSREVERNLRTERLQVLALNDAWVEEHGRVTALLSGTLFSTFVGVADRSELQAVSELLDMVLKLKEGHVRHLLATALHVSNVKSYGASLSASTGAVFKLAESHFPGLQLGALNRTLRNAAGHVAFNVDESGVIVRENGTPRRFPLADFLNDVLEYLELSVILQMGLVRACAELGIAIPASRHVSNSDRRMAIRAFAAAVGWENITVTDLAPVTRISAEGSSAALTRLGCGLVSLLPEDAEQISVELRDGERLRRCEVDLVRLRMSNLTEDVLTVAGALQLARIAASHRVDGTTASTPDEWASFAHAIALDETATEIRRLRALRELRFLAEESGVGGLARVAESHQARLRKQLEPRGSERPSDGSGSFVRPKPELPDLTLWPLHLRKR